MPGNPCKTIVRLGMIVWLMCLATFSLLSCRAHTVRAAEMVRAACAKETNLPDGRIYCSDAENGNENAEQQADRELCAGLYGEGDFPPALSQCTEYAFFLPVRQHPCEFAVFFCQTADAADAVARMCLTRREMLIAAWRGSDYEAYPIDACVRIRKTGGRYIVFFLVCADAEDAYRAARLAG